MKMPHIGKRGVIGIIVFLLGLMVLVSANSDAKKLSQQLWEHDWQESVLYDSNGEFGDTVRNGNIKSGLFWMSVGAGLVIWGYKQYGKNPPPPK